MVWTRIDAVAFTLFLDQLTNLHNSNNYGNLILSRYKESFISMSDDRKKSFYDRAKKICRCLREDEPENSHMEEE